MQDLLPKLRSVVLPVFLVLSGAVLHGQDPTDPGNPQGQQGNGRAGIWYPPTAEDWKKPVLITFQRTWEDAVAVSHATGHPILVCVNMDGEPASEHYAGVRYRQPEIAKLYEPYVCVMASVYRHNPRDYDDEGHRILCPRFGSVTCGEHIAMEPIVYEKFLDGRRIAPRHIMVELDGSETYDIYYAMDTDSVFKAIGDGIAERAVPTPPIVRGDKSIVERVASRDVVDRDAVEKAYSEGDAQTRRNLLEAASAHPEAAPDGLLRQAVFGLDLEMGKLARKALARANSESSVDVIAEALRVPMESGEREGLVGALERIGAISPRARTLAVVHRGLASKVTAVDVEGWSKALSGGASYAAAAQQLDAATKVERSEAATRSNPEDPTARAALAEALLAQAFDPSTARPRAAESATARRLWQLTLEDARNQALEAEKLGAKGFAVDATVALSAYYLGDQTTAMQRAEAAMKSLPTDPTSWTTMAVVAVFAEGRQRAIREAVQGKQEWPQQWMGDVHAAYALLARHPLGTDRQVVSHHDFLVYLGAYGEAARVLEDGLTRFPESWELHDRLRSQILSDSGVDGLESTYDAMLARNDAPKNLRWFAGYAALVAAEFHRRAGERDASIAAYGRAIAHYEQWIVANEATRATADHYVAVAHGGLARIAFEADDDQKALDEVLASFRRKPDSANALDGLNLSSVDTAKVLLARLKQREKGDLAARLQTALDDLDPKMLEPPAYERDPQGSRPSGTNRPRRRGR
ncbi:MAG: hypothetical protein U1F36_00705 [Planctomycetota bacterium]